jgi:hypothetical protein
MDLKREAFERDLPNVNYDNLKRITSLTSFHEIGRTLYQDTTTNVYYLHQTEDSWSDTVPDMHRWCIYDFVKNFSFDKFYIEKLSKPVEKPVENENFWFVGKYHISKPNQTCVIRGGGHCAHNIIDTETGKTRWLYASFICYLLKKNNLKHEHFNEYDTYHIQNHCRKTLEPTLDELLDTQALNPNFEKLLADNYKLADHNNAIETESETESESSVSSESSTSSKSEISISSFKESAEDVVVAEEKPYTEDDEWWFFNNYKIKKDHYKCVRAWGKLSVCSHLIVDISSNYQTFLRSDEICYLLMKNNIKIDHFKRYAIDYEYVRKRIHPTEEEKLAIQKEKEELESRQKAIREEYEKNKAIADQYKASTYLEKLKQRCGAK